MCRTFFLMGIVLFHLYTLCIVSLTIVDNKELPTAKHLLYKKYIISLFRC